ncbi:glutamate receptor ionotropic, kainate glr-3-like [Tigriopus californicus]|uniref:glutamate receptor ionotropic, kainate glr-3-like n=1 Tax=Tigriopus californicus TaxID=6832 RepID=UPI0027DA0C55|nr:glutamate receptor ionotropic, kainate glr-3-like [Tigriopus californicus]
MSRSSWLLSILMVGSITYGDMFQRINPFVTYMEMRGGFILCHVPLPRDLFRDLPGSGIWTLVADIESWSPDGHLDQNVIVCAQDVGGPLNQWLHSFPSLGTRKPVLIVTEKAKEYNATYSVINQRVYFLGLDTLKLSERYQVNERKIQRNLAQINHNSNSVTSFVTIGFLPRRSNFHGLNLKAMIGNQSPFLNIQGASEEQILTPTGDFMTRFPFDQVTGSFKDVMVIMAKELNFSVSYFQRRDLNWGNKVNGTWSGMVSTLLKGEADFIGASLTLTPTRFEAVDYLLPIGRETYAIFIKTSAQEDFDWKVFILPFSTGLWQFLLFNALIMVLAVKALERYHISVGESRYKSNLKHCEDLIMYYWIVLCTYFGKAFPLGSGKTPLPASKQWLFFTIMFVGNVMLMAYRASLTSELSNRTKKWPFITLDQLLISDYQLLARKGGFSDSLFTNAEEGSIFHSLYNKFLKDDRDQYMINDIPTLLQELMQSKKRALFYLLETVYTYPEYNCQISAPWISNYPNFLSMAFPKSSPYKEFFQFLLYEHLE